MTSVESRDSFKENLTAVVGKLVEEDDMYESLPSHSIYVHMLVSFFCSILMEGKRFAEDIYWMKPLRGNVG